MQRITHSASLLLLASLLTSPAMAADSPAEPTRDLSAWRSAKFGLFIHWGPVSLIGKEISWSRKSSARRAELAGQVEPEVYDNLYKRFNPTGFDPVQWVQLATDAGTRYLVFTTKHHDGFCNFDSKLTDYKITASESPYGKDIVAQLAEACHEADFPLGFYYSQPDWHHPDYRTEQHQQYIDYMHGQVEELLSHYGRVRIMWFDGLGGKAEDWDARELFATIRKLQPGILINNRCGLPGDFITPEQEIGRFNNKTAWESCMTIGTQWAYKPNDKIRSLRECIQTLVRVVGGDGNLLLNVGPDPEGRIVPEQADRLREIGDWLERYGESIYDTRGGPWAWVGCHGTGQASTRRGSTVYLHMLNVEEIENGLVLPGIPRRIVSSALLTGGDVRVEQTADAVTVHVPEQYRDPLDTIVKLTLDRSAMTIPPVIIACESLAAGKPATASSVLEPTEKHVPGNAFDENPHSHWVTAPGTKQAVVEVDLQKPYRLGRAVIQETYPGRIKNFRLEYKQGDQWKAIVHGQYIGRERRIEFPPVEARYVRLNILEAAHPPAIQELKLFER